MSTITTGYNPTNSVLSGMTTLQLTTALTNAQQAYVDLMTGARTIRLTYEQGDGKKSVDYDKVDISQLQFFIKMLQSQLGLPVQTRRPLRFRF